MDIYLAILLLRKLKKLDPRKYNGAIFLGLNAPVVKSHGGADAFAFYNSLNLSYQIINGNLINKIKNNFIIIMSNNVTRQDLYDLTHKELGISKNECIKFVDSIFETLIKNFEKGNKVKISLFGSFNIKQKKSRIGRNPKTLETKEISSRKVITFKPSKFLSRKINK